MPFFKSTREKRLWIWALLVFIAIFTSLFIGWPVVKFFESQNLQAIIFLVGMLLVGIALLLNAWKNKPGPVEGALWLGISAVYIMFMLRLGLPERSHLFEYSILAIIIFEIILERRNRSVQIAKSGLTAIGITFLISVLDESLQLILPNRVFDPLDILFNGFVIVMAIGWSLLVQWLRKRRSKSSKNKEI